MYTYSLNALNQPDELIIITLTKYAPILIGKYWTYFDNTVFEFDDNWLGGKKPTLALVEARQIVVDDYRTKFLAAIARTEAELKIAL